MKLRTLLMLVLVFALVAAACGGDGTEETTTTTAAAVDETTTTTAAPTTTTEPPDETTTTSGGGGSPAALAALRASLEKSSDASKAKMAGSMTLSGIPDMPGDAFIIPFSGAFDNEAGNFSFVMDMSFLAEQGGEEIPPEFASMFGEMEVRTIGDTTYIRFPFLALFLGVQTEWIAAPADEGMDAAGSFGVAGTTPGNPADFLEAFEQADATVEVVDDDVDIRGVKTTHYLVTFDMEKLLAEATPEERAQIEEQGPLPIDSFPMNIWISDDGLVYKYVIELVGEDLDLPPDEEFGSMIMEFEMYDYGEDIVIEPPPADQVTDLDTLEFALPDV